MKLTPRLLLIGAAIVLPLGLGLWARSAASWRLQKLGRFNTTLVKDEAHGPWIYESENKLLNLDNHSEVILPPNRHGDPRFSPDGRSFAVFTGHETGITDAIEWRDCASGSLLRRFTEFQGDGDIRDYDLHFSDDNAKLLVFTGRVVETLPLDGSKGGRSPLPKLREFSFLSMDGKWLCSHIGGTPPPRTKWKIYEVKTGRLQQAIKHGRPTPISSSSAFSPDGSLLGFVDGDEYGSNAAAWVGDAKSGAKLWDASSSWVFPHLLFSPDSQNLLIFDDSPNNPRLELVSARTGKRLYAFQLIRSLSEAEFSSDGSIVYGLDSPGTIWKIRVR